MFVFLPLSFYAKKKVAERKARIRGIAPRYATLLFGAVSPLYIPLMTAQPIAKVFVYTRNGRRVRRLPFLKEKYHAYHLSLSESENSYTRIYSTIMQLNFSKISENNLPAAQVYAQYNGIQNFQSAAFSVTLPEKDLLYQSFRQAFFKGLCTSQWQAKLSVSNYLGHSARERLPLIKVFARPFSKRPRTPAYPPRTPAFPVSGTRAFLQNNLDCRNAL